MKSFNTVIIVFFVCFLILPNNILASSHDDFGHLYSQTMSSSANLRTQESAVLQLIERILPGHGSAFNITVNSNIGPANKDTFVLQTVGKVTSITGSSGVAAAWGFGHYLKVFCNCQFSWAEDQLNVPNPLPTVMEQIKITSNDRFRYYQNVCTVSYSSPWWSWQRWQREIDWMAINAINLPLAFTGQEAIWTRVFLKMGLTQTEVDEFLGGPAFLAWSRMGNLRGWGGPLPAGWNANQLGLQKQILQRMRDLGMTPVLPAFAGHVPRNITRVFPGVKLIPSHHWGSFKEQFCCVSMIDFNDPVFAKIGSAFLEEQEKEFGTNHYYNADTFNEMVPSSNAPAYLQASGAAVYKAMATHDPNAVWVMQGWLFLNSFWQPPQVKALVTSVPVGRMLILDLFSEQSPQFSRFESFYGQPFIWNMLHNFGGTLGLFGQMQKINENPSKARSFPNSTMVGTGLTPEGINQNYVMYEFMNEQAWRTGPTNLTQWIIDYSRRRYGAQDAKLEKVWMTLLDSVYSASSQHSHLGQMITNRPSLLRIPEKELWYSPTDVMNAWQWLYDVALQYQHLPTYMYDLVDLTRQSVQIMVGLYYAQVKEAYLVKNSVKLHNLTLELDSLFEQLDKALSANQHFRLSNWTGTAAALATNDADRKLYVYNARNQITLWGPQGNIMDYAGKQWSGVINQYTRPRWALFMQHLEEAVNQKKPFDQGKYNTEVFKTVEEPFTFQPEVTSLPFSSSNEALDTIGRLLQTHKPVADASEYIRKLDRFGPEYNARSATEELENPMLYKYQQG